MVRANFTAIWVAAILLGVSGARGQVVDTGTWSFEPTKDEFSPKASLDLRSLNEKVAGESGFLTRSTDGMGFLLGDGKEIRLWGVGDSAWSKHAGPQVDLARHARWLAKLGINTVRVHCSLGPGKDQKLTDVNRTDLDGLWRMVAAMKQEGIYTIFSPYWASASAITPAMGRLDSGGDCEGLLFFDKNLQAAYKGWMKVILTEKNPYTGIPLGQDPSIGLVELQNEDSLLFWSSQHIKGAAKTELRRQFAAFCQKKYGTLEKALAAWDGAAPAANEDAPDAFGKGEVGLYIIWQMTQSQTGGPAKRLTDQLDFFTTTMFNFNKEMGDYIHHELGSKVLVNAGNWRTAENVRLLDAERYSYTADEVMAVNRYYSPLHTGANAGWAIVRDDQFQDVSCLLSPRDFPVSIKQVAGYPMLITESSWVPPLGYQSEGPFLVAAYESLTGVAGYYWFATREEEWREPGSANGYLPSEGKWVCATPMLAGQWPAAALMYRRGYIQKGEPAVVECRAIQDIMTRREPIIAEDPGFDPNRDQGQIAVKSNIKAGVNPLAFLVGPVIAKYGADPGQSKVLEMGKYIDATAKTVKSDTGELVWDYGRGICTLNAPKAQGVTGFLKKVGSFKLSDIAIVSGNDYATVLVVAMDDKPLGQSGQVLVQVGTIERPTGWKTREVMAMAGKEQIKAQQVVSFGAKPWQIVKTDVMLTIRNPAIKTASVLDAGGMVVKELPLEAAEDGKRLKLPADALYVVLR